MKSLLLVTLLGAVLAYCSPEPVLQGPSAEWRRTHIGPVIKSKSDGPDCNTTRHIDLPDVGLSLDVPSCWFAATTAEELALVVSAIESAPLEPSDFGRGVASSESMVAVFGGGYFCGVAALAWSPEGVAFNYDGGHMRLFILDAVGSLRGTVMAISERLAECGRGVRNYEPGPTFLGEETVLERRWGCIDVQGKGSYADFGYVVDFRVRVTAWHGDWLVMAIYPSGRGAEAHTDQVQRILRSIH